MQRLGRGIGYTLLLNALSTALVFLASVVFARLLNVSDYGVYAYVVAVVNLLTVVVLVGFDRLVTREVAARRDSGEWHVVGSLLTHANLTVLALSGVTLLVLTTGGIAIAGMNLSQATLALWIGLLALPFAALGRIRQAALIGLQQLPAGLVPETVVRPALLLAGPLVLGVLLGVSLTAVVAVGIFALASVAAFAVGSLLYLYLRPPELRHAGAGFAGGRWLRTSAELGLVAAAGMLVSQVDLLLLGTLASAETTGQYAVAWRAAALIAFGLTAVNTPIGPLAARLWAAGDRESLQRAITSSARVATLIALPVAAVFIVFGEGVLAVFGPAYQAAYWVLAILSIGQLVNAAMGPVGMLLIMTGHHRTAVKGMAVGIAVTALTSLALIPGFGAEGAAVAAALGTVTWNVLLARSVFVTLGLHTTALGPVRLQKV